MFFHSFAQASTVKASLLFGDFGVEHSDHFSRLSWDSVAVDVDDVVFVVDPDDLEADDLGHLVADVSWQLLARPHSGLVSAGADASGPAVGLGHAQGVRTSSGEAPTFHHALETSSGSVRWVEEKNFRSGFFLNGPSFFGSL